MDKRIIDYYVDIKISDVIEKLPQTIQSDGFRIKLQDVIGRFLAPDNNSYHKIEGPRDVYIKTPTQDYEYYEILFENNTGPISIGYVYPRANLSDRQIHIYINYLGGEPRVFPVTFQELEELMTNEPNLSQLILDLLTANPEFLRDPKQYGILDLIRRIAQQDLNTL